MKLEEVKKKQELLDKRFEEEGLTDELLEEQVKLNMIVNEKNIIDDDGGFVQ